VKTLRTTNKRTEKGFAFISALLIMLLLTSLGILIFTLTSRDLRTSIKIEGEKKAISGAEHAVAIAIQNFGAGATSGGNPNDPSTWPIVDIANPATHYYYSIGAASTGCSLPPAGYDLEKWSQSVYDVDARGANTLYMSQAQLGVGIGIFKSGTCAKTTE
jgi:Tfp pilus assembly protein PilX